MRTIPEKDQIITIKRGKGKGLRGYVISCAPVLVKCFMEDGTILTKWEDELAVKPKLPLSGAKESK